MALEIERKFLVNGKMFPRPNGGVRMRQGYVATKNDVTVRVRIDWTLLGVVYRARRWPIRQAGQPTVMSRAVSEEQESDGMT